MKARLKRNLPGLAALVLSSGVAASVVYTEKSLYRDISVSEDGVQRCMIFGRQGGRQSCIGLTRQDELALDYTRMMLGALYLNPAPQRVLIVGLGGGTLPRALQRLYPGTQFDVVEIDPAVVRVASRYFDFKPGERMRVHEGDARVFVKRALRDGVRYDLVMLDAFDHDYIPEHLLTREFLLEIQALLGERGVLAANTFANSRLYAHESATYHSAFGDFYNLKRNNRVILWRRGGLPDAAELARNAEALEPRLAPLGVARQWMLPLFVVEKPAAQPARVLTDQYSPSNLLNTR